MAALAFSEKQQETVLFEKKPKNFYYLGTTVRLIDASP
jgi:hypothetical protein